MDKVTEAIGFDSRVGGKYLRAGLGFGGTCFPRDNLAFQAFAGETGCDAKLSRATVSINDGVVNKLFDFIRSSVSAQGAIALLGLSYKPNTHVTEKSQPIALARKLADYGYAVSVYDPEAMEDARCQLGGKVRYCDDSYDCCCGADAVVVLTFWPEFEHLDWDRIDKSVSRKAVLLDSWRQLRDRNFKKFNYMGLGLGEINSSVDNYGPEYCASL